jgi:hypothetical protein
LGDEITTNRSQNRSNNLYHEYGTRLLGTTGHRCSYCHLRAEISSKEPTSILSGNWKFTAQLRESRSGELEFWLYRYLTAPPPHSDDMLSEVEELPPAVAVTCLFNWGSFAATTLNSASNGAGHSVTSSLIFAIFGWQN